MNPVIRTVIIFLLFFSLACMLLLTAGTLPVFEQSLFSLLPDTDTLSAVQTGKPGSFLHIGYILFSSISLFFGIFLFIAFRKTTSPEILYLIIAVFSLTMLGLRYPLLLAALNPDLLLSSRLLGRIDLISRLFFFFYIFAITLLFFGGMFSNGIPLLKQNMFILVSFVASSTLAVLVPLNAIENLAENSAFLSFPGIVVSSIRIIELFACLNYLIAAKRNNNTQYVLPSIGLMLLFIGLEIFTSLPYPLFTVAGLILYGSGLLIFTNRIYTINLWN
ncbi:MAG: hypothetical protein K9L21_04315 [Spirochaetia bacterium]|nr:hypothetical protein [Spirochaetia bacterium]